jgi:hypothetical protein
MRALSPVLHILLIFFTLVPFAEEYKVCSSSWQFLYSPTLSHSSFGFPASSKDSSLLQIPDSSVSQPPGRGPVPDPWIKYNGLREVFLEFVILVF